MVKKISMAVKYVGRLLSLGEISQCLLYSLFAFQVKMSEDCPSLSRLTLPFRTCLIVVLLFEEITLAEWHTRFMSPWKVARIKWWQKKKKVKSWVLFNTGTFLAEIVSGCLTFAGQVSPPLRLFYALKALVGGHSLDMMWPRRETLSRYIRISKYMVIFCRRCSYSGSVLISI